MTPMQLMGYYQRKCERGGCGAPVFFTVIFFVWLLFGCKETEYVPVREVHTVYQNHTDTVCRTDTVRGERETVIREVSREDSAMLARYGIRLNDNERMILMLQRELEKVSSQQYEIRTDTFNKTDSVPVPYPVPAQLTAWQGVKVRYGGYAMAVVFCIVIGVLLRLGKKLPP